VRTDESEHWDIRAVMEGGIPNRELDELAPYWQTLPGLREALFETSEAISEPMRLPQSQSNGISLCRDCGAELPTSVVSALADAVKALEKKYASIMSDVAGRIST